MKQHIWRLAVTLSLVGCASERPAEQTDAAGPADGTGEVAAPDGDSTRGMAFYEAEGCAACHVEGGADPYLPPPLAGLGAEVLLAFLDGTAPHTGGEIAGVTEGNARDLAAYLATIR